MKVNSIKRLCLAALILFMGSTAHIWAQQAPSLMATKNAPSIGTYHVHYMKTNINKNKHFTLAYNLLADLKFEEAIKELKLCLSDYSSYCGEVNGKLIISPKATREIRSLISETYTFLGYCYSNLMKPEQAIKYLHYAIELDPTNEYAYFYLGCEYQHMGQFENMQKSLTKAVELSPSFTSALRLLAENYKDQGNPECLTYYRKLVEVLPNSGYYRFQLYRTLFAFGHYKEAETQILELIKLEPHFIINYERLASVYLKTKQYGKSLNAYDQLLKDNRYKQLAHIGKAKVYMEMGDLAESKKELAIASELGQGTSDMVEIRNRIDNEQKEKRKEVVGTWVLISVLLIMAGTLAFYVYSTNRKKYILSIITELNEKIENIYDVNELGTFLPAYFAQLLKMKEGFLLVYNRQNNTLQPAQTNHLGELRDFQIVTGNEVTNWLMQESRPVMSLKDIERSRLFAEAFPSLMERLRDLNANFIVTLKDKNAFVGFIVFRNQSETVQDSGILPPAARQRDLLNPIIVTASQALQTLFLFEISIVDELTGLYNKRYFFQTLGVELRRADQYKQPCSLCYFDIDDFKKINDTYGHAQGDSVLKEIGSLIRNGIREGIDVGIRAGGEEFNLILPATSPELARTVAERVRTAIQDHKFEGFDKAGYITVSAGISTYPDFSRSDDELIKTSDQALYLAKRTGKNKVSDASELDTAKGKRQFKEEFSLDNRFDQLNIREEATGLYNFTYLSMRLKEEIKRAKRYKAPCSILVVSLSPQPAENMREEAIQSIAEMIGSQHREGIDIPARYNEDSLIMVLPATPPEKAMALAERLQATAAEKQIVSDGVVLNVMLGIASYPEHATSAGELLKLADLAVKEGAKSQHRIVVASCPDNTDTWYYK